MASRTASAEELAWRAWQLAVVREGEIAGLSIDARLDVRELYEAAAEPSA